VSLVDVAARTTGARRREVGRFVVSEVAFARDCRLARHEHPRACIAVVVAGSVSKSYARRTHEATRGTVVTMPQQEPHADLFGGTGARLVVVESDDRGAETSVFRHWGAAELAHRIGRELAEPDDFSELALEGLALELAALAGRGETRACAAPWLDDAAEILHERFRDPPTAAELATAVGVRPAELARGFRARFGEGVGCYARNLRLDWAAERLARTDAALARIACEAGFADQSHFTRAFARRFGVPPGRYRRTRI
jgi:AraC-like DNA-binding protein/quercetin dioxygenase-like cupin family protein